MLQIDRYLLRQMAGPLLATLAIALLVLLIERGLRLLDRVLAAHGSFRLLLEMLTYLVPHYVGMALPLGLFLAVLLAFSRLGRDNEMDALQAAGISLFRLARPVVMTALAATLLAWIVFDYLQPFGRYAYRAAAFTVEHAAVHTFLQEDVFVTVEGATVLVGEIAGDRRQFANVFVHKESDGTSRVIAAPYARFETGESGEAPVLTFVDGTDMRVPVAQAHALEPADVLRFETFTAPLGERGMAAFRPRGKDERELTLTELWHRLEAPPPDAEPDEVRGELHGRLVRIASVAIVPFLAVPFALGRKRTPQPLRLAAGVIALVAYNEILDVGETLVSAGRAEPLVMLWLPFVLLGVACLWAVLVIALWPSLRLLPARHGAGGGHGTRTGAVLGPHEP